MTGSAGSPSADQVADRFRAGALLPWTEPAAEQIRAAWAHGRLHHALLIHGADGLGKRAFALWLGRALLCESKTGILDICGRCPACQLTLAGSHPDLRIIEPEEDKQQISIDQIRQLCEALGMTAFRGGYKVAILNPAHQMTPAAANSLLKTLEEPGANTVLMLLTSRPTALPATIRSRCRKLGLRVPSAEIAARWLQEAQSTPVDLRLVQFSGGAPLKALAYADGSFDKLNQQMQASWSDLLAGKADVMEVAKFWADEVLPERLRWLDVTLCSLARGAVTGSAELVTFPARPVPLPKTGRALNISAVYGLVDQIRELKAQLARTALQRELALEVLLMACLQTLAPAAMKA
jgi:DNA polymerase-3 subunit delta'